MIRILDHAWHQAHSYRLHALPAQIDYFPIGVRGWDPAIRPQPANWGGFVSNPNLAEYDVIMSHYDNWCDHRRGELRGTPFRIMNLMAMDAPQAARVCIMHGSPDDDGNRQRLVRMLDLSPGGPPFLVLNSKQAYRAFGLGPERSRAIWHGYDVDEFWSSKERQCWAVTVCSAGDISRVYHGVPMLEAVRQRAPVIWFGYNGDLPYFKSYQAYREFLSTTLIYVHCGQGSPMPGARTEAMLSGCCVVTTSNHDAGEVIEHGETGFLCDSAEEMAETIQMLLVDPRRAYLVGQRGREVARALFEKERFVADWLNLLEELGVEVSA